MAASQAMLHIVDGRPHLASLPMTKLMHREEFPERLRRKISSSWLEKHPGYGSTEIRLRYIELAEKVLSGKGNCVVANDWLGCLATCLAEGVRRRGVGGAPCIQLIVDDSLRDWMAPTFTRLHVPFTVEGQQQLLDDLLAPWKDLLSLTKQQKMSEMHVVAPIELLVLDRIDDWNELNQWVSLFFPSLMVETSLISHQYYALLATRRFVLLMYTCREFFEHEPNLSNDEMLVFRLVKPVPSEILHHRYSSSDFTTADVRKAFQWVQKLAPDCRRTELLAAENAIVSEILESRIDQDDIVRVASQLQDLFKHRGDCDGLDDRIARYWLDRSPGPSPQSTRQFMIEFAEKNMTGKGECLVLGDWLGNHSACLAEGFRRRGDISTRIHTFEKKEVEPWMEPTFTRYGFVLTADQKQELFRALIAPWCDRIQVEFGDPEKPKSIAGPIELLDLGCLDTWNLCQMLMRDVLSLMLPGESHVIVHNFSGINKPWFTRLLDCFENYFTILPSSVEDPRLLILRVEKQMPKVWMSTRSDRQDISIDSFDTIISRLDRGSRMDLKTTFQDDHRDLSQ